MKRVTVVIGSRANYASIKSALVAMQRSKQIDLSIVVMASAVLERYGNVASIIERDGFKINERISSLVEGETPLSMAKSAGLGLIELTTVFDRLQPEVIFTIGDRYETISTAVAATYMNIPLAHTMGGEVTGTIDESIRHAVTKFAHIHFPASKEAAERIIKLGENPESIFLVGCPRVDLVRELLEGVPKDNAFEDLMDSGVGADLDFSQPFILVSQHPVTTEFANSQRDILETLQAVKNLGLQALVLWPNSDAGSDEISKGIRRWRESETSLKMRFYKNLPAETYLRLMDKTACLVGNSSSGIREGAYIGTPVVNIGSRQQGRERGLNVVDASPNKSSILEAISGQLDHGKYGRNDVYGDGRAGQRIAEIVATLEIVKIQKRIAF